MSTRRDILESVAGAGLLSIAAAAFVRPEALASRPKPTAADDAELIALCNRFDELERHYTGLHGEGPLAALRISDEKERDAALEPIQEEQEHLLDRMNELRAVTLAGQRARAAFFVLWAGETPLRQIHGVTPGLFIEAIVRDLAGGGVA